MSEYGDGCAEFYDELYGPPNPHIVRVLSRLAKYGSVLELGLATGRTALALRQHCAEICGIESSRAMLDCFVSKEGAQELRIIEGNFANIRLADCFDLIFALVNTIFLLETKQELLECLGNVCSMLKENGVFVLEAFRPNDSLTQTEAKTITHSHTVMTTLGVRQYEARVLHYDVDELDLLASSVGLELKERWANWKESPYVPGARQHISLYTRCDK
jgi:SAM-dependent methyltransferase